MNNAGYTTNQMEHSAPGGSFAPSFAPNPDLGLGLLHEPIDNPDADAATLDIQSSNFGAFGPQEPHLASIANDASRYGHFQACGQEALDSTQLNYIDNAIVSNHLVVNVCKCCGHASSGLPSSGGMLYNTLPNNSWDFENTFANDNVHINFQSGSLAPDADFPHGLGAAENFTGSGFVQANPAWSSGLASAEQNNAVLPSMDPSFMGWSLFEGNQFLTGTIDEPQMLQHGLPPALPAEGSAPIRNTAAPAVPCTQPNCPVLFKRASDIPRHLATAHGINQRVHFCPVMGCNKSFGTGYTRADKVKEHCWKKHAGLGFRKSR